MLKTLLGIGDLDLSDREIMARLKEASDHNLDAIEFLRNDGSKVIIKMPHLDASKYEDPWDSGD